MKNSKNNYVIIGLTLFFLFFFAGCGKKDKDEEIKLPLEINKNQIQNSISKLELPEKTTSQKEKNKVGENEIFGFAENLANSTSQPLNTDINYEEENLANTTPQSLNTDINFEEENPEPEPDPSPNITIYGQAVRTDGTAITNIFIKAIPRGIYELSGNPGHVTAKVKVDESGCFEISGLIPDNYKLNISADDSDSITTNIVLYSDSANSFEFIFPEVKYQTIKGIVKYELTDEPAAGIKVKCKTGNSLETIATTKEGVFEFTLPIIENKFTRLKINEHGYTKIDKPIRIHRYTGESILFLLKETGIITGKITNESGKPLSGIRTTFYPKHEYDSKSKISLSRGRGYRYSFGRSAYTARTETSSNEEGIYVISNAAAPKVYTLKYVSGWNEYLPKDYYPDEIEVLPGKTTTFDFKVFSKPVIKIQVKDEKGKPILKYTLETLTKYINGYRPGTYNVNLSDENDWYSINVIPKDGETKIFFAAKTQDGQIARKDNIKVETGETYELILKVGENSPDVAGFVYNSDMTPCIDGYIRARCRSGFAVCKTDYLGYFEFSGMNADKGAIILLSMRKDNISYPSRVLIGNNDFEWILPELKLITGRVCIENSAIPATNFAVSIMNPHNKKYFHSIDGTFSIQVNPRFTKRKFKVYIFAAGYAYKSVEINMKNLDLYDIGDAILMNKPATVIGKVVDKQSNPVNSKVILENINNSESSMRAMTDGTDGSFEFTDIPPGKYVITASAQSNNVESETFELHSDEYYISPDLIF